jgi:anti-anti-sigma factor
VTCRITVVVPEEPGEDVRVRLVGDIDVRDHELVMDTAARAVAAHRPVTFDCHELSFLDSSAIALFALVLRAGRTVTVTGLSPLLKPMFEITGLDRLLHFA